MDDSEKDSKIERIGTDADFINSKTHKYSIKKLRSSSDRPMTDKVIASFLLISTEDVAKIYDALVSKIRSGIGLT
jgi:hypothetical protein